MYPVPGHLSVALVLRRYCKLAPIPVIAAAFFPDVIDKTLSDILHITTYGRSIMHSLTGVLVVSFALYVVKSRQWGISWMIGHLGHLLGDWSFIPLFYPFKEYVTPVPINVYNLDNLQHVLFDWRVFLLECGMLILASIATRYHTMRKEIHIALIVVFAGLVYLRV